MPSEVVLGKIYAALKTVLAAYAPLTGLLAVKPIGGAPGIYDDGSVPQAALMPYLTIGAGTQVPAHSMGEVGSARYGWNCTLQIKGIGQIPEIAGLTLMGHVATALYEGRVLGVEGYSNAWCDEITVQPTLVTTQAGVVTREWPLILRVFAFD